MFPVLAALGLVAPSHGQSAPPPVPREFRAAWVATVDNIDWPSRRGLSSETQKAELIRILDKASALRLNAIILQVRPAADAFYDSSIEPWSEYLSGRQGEPPNPYYDPLAFAVAEAHKRGLELHAWFNPYRAYHPSAKSPLAANHIAKTHPEVIRRYGDLLWMDPGEPFVQKRSLDVVEDVVRRYDVDGIHIDDYFYPYPERGMDFPDGQSFASRGGRMDRGDWRRKNVDNFVESVYTGIHSIKPWVQFGISPFGIYRPGIPSGIRAGVDQFAELYADPLKWLQNGWCDYMSPQLYWPIGQKPQSFPVLMSWWASKNPLRRHIWPGLFTSRTMDHGKSRFGSGEIVNQIKEVRKLESDAGEIHFSMKAFTEDGSGIDEALLKRAYTEDALPPASPWLEPDPPGIPSVTLREDGTLTWKPGNGKAPFWYVVSALHDGKWFTRVVPGSDTQTKVQATNLQRVFVAAASRCAVLSNWVEASRVGH